MVLEARRCRASYGFARGTRCRVQQKDREAADDRTATGDPCTLLFPQKVFPAVHLDGAGMPHGTS